MADGQQPAHRLPTLLVLASSRIAFRRRAAASRLCCSAISVGPASAMATRLAFWDSISRTLAAKVARPGRSEEHTSELQSLMRISYAVFCLKKKKKKKKRSNKHT